MELMQVKNIEFSYDNKRKIFSGVSFNVNEGEVFCLIGANGCGKSTLIDCILGLNKLKTGEIIVDGRNISTFKPKEFAAHIAYIPQNHKTTFSYSVLDVVTMGRTYAAKMFLPPSEDEKEIARQALADVGLSGFEDREYTKLSGGELQLVLIARALAQKSKLLVMDEPTAHLDFRHELNVMEIISKLVKTQKLSIIMATHFLNQAYYLENAGVPTRVALMEGENFGMVGKPSDVLVPEHLENVFNIVTELASDGSGKRKYILTLYNKGKIK